MRSLLLLLSPRTSNVPYGVRRVHCSLPHSAFKLHKLIQTWGLRLDEARRTQGCGPAFKFPTYETSTRCQNRPRGGTPCCSSLVFRLMGRGQIMAQQAARVRRGGVCNNVVDANTSMIEVVLSSTTCARRARVCVHRVNTSFRTAENTNVSSVSNPHPIYIHPGSIGDPPSLKANHCQWWSLPHAASNHLRNHILFTKLFTTEYSVVVFICIQ